MSQLLTIKEVAEVLKVSHRTISDWVYKRKIPYIKVGRVVRFDQQKIENWINNRTVTAK